MQDTEFVMAVTARLDSVPHKYKNIVVLRDTVGRLVGVHDILPQDWAHVLSVLREAMQDRILYGPGGRLDPLTYEAKEFLLGQTAVKLAELLVAMYSAHVEYETGAIFINTWASSH